jgi:tripartite-type tricarboxylate transporter receptor subunit TctC
MTPLLGRPIVAENIAGAGSTLGANTFQQAPANGQTIYVATNNHALMKLVYPQFADDPAVDVVPVALATRQAFVHAVYPSVAVNSVPEHIAWLRQRGAAANCKRGPAGGRQLHGGQAAAPPVRDTLKTDLEPQVRAKFRELAAPHLTPAGMDAIEAAVDRCEEWQI